MLRMGYEPSVLAAVGLAREAKIAARARLMPIIGAARGGLLERRLADAIAKLKPKGIVSFGIAGALAPLLKVGDTVIATHVVHDNEHHATDPEWSGILREKLPDAHSVVLAGHDRPVSHVDGKRRLFALTGAHAVDMESHIAARLAARAGIPFVALRTISDSSLKGLPPAALASLRENGKSSLRRVLASLAGEPAQLGDLLATGRDASKAFGALLRCRDALGLFLGCPYLG